MAQPATPLQRVAVLGAGTMGLGIAQAAATAGMSVRLFDVDAQARARALPKLREGLRASVERGKLAAAQADEAVRRIEVCAALPAALRDADLAVEAIVEDLDCKRALFLEMEAHAPEACVLATNTSSLPVGRIAQSLRAPARLIGMHFFNPVPAMKLVEIVVHAQTSERARTAALEVARRLEKEPIVVRDSPGFASSRLGVVLGLEAMRMLEQNVASAADIDKAMELGYRHPMGPLKLTDLVGLDVRLAIAQALHRALGGAQYEPPQILRDKVARGELGRKSGKGFYDWNE